MYDGVWKNLFVQGGDWSTFSVNEKCAYLGHNNRDFLMNEASENEVSSFQPQLLGGSVSYDLDLSGVGCSCVALIIKQLYDRSLFD